MPQQPSFLRQASLNRPTESEQDSDGGQLICNWAKANLPRLQVIPQELFCETVGVRERRREWGEEKKKMDSLLDRSTLTLWPIKNLTRTVRLELV